jgi:hypothetical protein
MINVHHSTFDMNHQVINPKESAKVHLRNFTPPLHGLCFIEALPRSQTPYPLGHAVIGINILKMVLKRRIQGVGDIIFFVCGASSKIKDLK